jgi:hypothetical protein
VKRGRLLGQALIAFKATRIQKNSHKSHLIVIITTVITHKIDLLLVKRFSNFINITKVHMHCYHSIDEEIRMETVLTVLFVAIGGLLAAMAYAIFGSKIRKRYHNDTFRTRSA